MNNVTFTDEDRELLRLLIVREMKINGNQGTLFSANVAGGRSVREARLMDLLRLVDPTGPDPRAELDALAGDGSPVERRSFAELLDNIWAGGQGADLRLARLERPAVAR